MRWKLDSTACDKKAIKEAPMARPGLVFFSRSRPRVEERRRDAPAVARGDAAKVVVVKKAVGDGEVEKEARAVVVAMGSVGRGSRRGEMDARGKEGSTKAQHAGGIDATIWLMAKERDTRSFAQGAQARTLLVPQVAYTLPHACVWVWVWVGGDECMMIRLLFHDVSANPFSFPTLLRSASLPHPCLLWVPVTTVCRQKKQARKR